MNGPDEMGGGEFIPVGSIGGAGAVLLIMRYHGNCAAAQQALAPLLKYGGPRQMWCGAEGFNPVMPSGYNIPLNGPVALISNFLDAESIQTKKAITKIMDWVSKPLSVLSLRGFGWQVIGGFASQVPDNATAVHPGFRKGLIAMSCFGFPFKPLYEFANSEFNDWGDGGAYVNEPQSQLPDWIERFWTRAKYEQLLVIKKKWDPDNVFIVHQGVGWDKVSNVTYHNEEDTLIVPSTSESTHNVAHEASVLTGMPDCSKTASPSQCQCAVRNCAAEINSCLGDGVCAAGLALLPHSPLVLMQSAIGIAMQTCVANACLAMEEINIV